VILAAIWRRLAGAHDSVLVGKNDRLHPVPDAELAENAGDVHLDRLGDHELVRDLGLRVARAT
jgi:hypothetical protein